jgi:hypothetical protein
MDWSVCEPMQIKRGRVGFTRAGILTLSNLNHQRRQVVLAALLERCPHHRRGRLRLRCELRVRLGGRQQPTPSPRRPPKHSWACFAVLGVAAP